MELKNKIPLRQFYRNIDDYVINQAHKEAILYSKFLLKKYPKNIAVYQLLAKAYLDKKQFDLALLLFEKILEIDPDDFVSHIGISIISENFGNLERALESMQRAYEIQPSNESLQNEVIRLVREKDGFAPEKLRLTRGALIKMYSRSKLTEQAIAEAKLGIHEAPDRTDYKVHLTEMLLESGKFEESIESSLNILRDLPYCKPILNVVYNAFNRLDKENDADIYKTRLSELDPYFVFMKPETKSVNDIPDVAIMVEAGPIPSDEILNIADFISEVWRITQSTEDHILQSKEQDWTSIVDEAVANEGIGSPIDEINADVVNSEDEISEVDSSEIRISKRKKLLNKLSNSPDQKQKENPFEEEIPDWILSYGALEKNASGIVAEEPVNDNEILPDSEISFEEDGMTDHDTPINPAIEEEGFKSEIVKWEQTDSEPALNKDGLQVSKLDDTQKIKVLKYDPEEILLQMKTAFEESDIEFAIQSVEALIEHEHALETISGIIEQFLEKNPGSIELWLILVKIYRKLNMNEKALSALQSAQMNISI